MSQKPLIGITCNYDYRDTLGMGSGVGTCGQDWNYVAGDYVYAIERAGGVPVLLPQCSDFAYLKPLLDMLDAVIISGGHDVGPENYGSATKTCCGTIIPMRDKQDLAVVDYMLKRKRPLLGICRGIQILNVAHGGTLYQDIPKEGGFESHSCGDRYPRNYPWHTVTLEEGSLLHKIFGKTEVRVNSYHHQAVWIPGKDVKITATSTDGVPEAIEVPGHDFVMAVQWHPEMMYDTDEQQGIFRAFVEAAAK